MSYTDLAQLTARFGADLLIRITDRAEVPTGVIDTDVVDQALKETDAIIDGYLEARYALPVASIPPQLVGIAQAIAVYKLHVFEAAPKIEQDYKDAMTMIREIGSGKIRLTIAGKPAASNGDSGVRTTDRKRPMTGESLKGFM